MIKLPPLTAYRMSYDVSINGQIGRLVRPNSRVRVVDGKLPKEKPNVNTTANATITAMRSTFNNITIEADVLIDGETEAKTLKLK